MDKYLKTPDSDWYKQRLARTMLSVMIAFAALIIRLSYLQIIEGEKYRLFSEYNRIRLQSISSPRGLIFDRNGELLVDNRPAFDLNITLKDARPVEKTLRKLSFYTGFSVEELKAEIRQSKKTSYTPIPLKKDISRELVAAIEVHQFDLPGVSVDVRSTRHYLYGCCASHVIGYLGEINSRELSEKKVYSGYHAGDLIGKFGVEKSAESYLKGQRGGRQVEVNSAGQVVRVLKTVNATAGSNIYLTIDLALQQRTEELIKGWASGVVAIDPKTGHILSLASNPSFDPNAFIGGISHDAWNELINNPLRPMENKVIQGEYPPASTYKIVTAMAGLEEKVINEKKTFYCPGHYKFGNRVFRCWRRGGHGWVNVVNALAVSCDVFFYQVGQKLGVDRIAKYAKACGLGDVTGIHLDHEGEGLIPTSAWKKKRMGVPWMGGETLPIAIGQGYNLTTPLQMAVLVSAVANGGTIYRPLIIKKINVSDNQDSEAEKLTEPAQVAGKLPASTRTLNIIKRGLWSVVNTRRGTARKASIEGIDVCGKTGTAQVVGRKSVGDRKNLADHLKPHAWFVAYAPAGDPEIAVAVIVENGEHGSSTAAPIAKEVIRFYLKGPEPDEEAIGAAIQSPDGDMDIATLSPPSLGTVESEVQDDDTETIIFDEDISEFETDEFMEENMAAPDTQEIPAE